MGFKMIRVIGEVRKVLKNENLNMRIGVHTVRTLFFINCLREIL